MQLLVNHEWSVPTSVTGTKVSGRNPILAEMLGWASKCTTYTMHLGYQKCIQTSKGDATCMSNVEIRGALQKHFARKMATYLICTVLLITVHRCNSYVLGKRAPWRNFLGLVPSIYSFFSFLG